MAADRQRLVAAATVFVTFMCVSLYWLKRNRSSSDAAQTKNISEKSSNCEGAIVSTVASQRPKSQPVTDGVGNVSATATLSSGELTREQVLALTSMVTMSTDEATLEKILVTVGNAAAFTKNQILFREAGLLTRLTGLVVAQAMALTVRQASPCPRLATGVMTAINNLSMNADNQTQLKECIPALIELASARPLVEESVQLASLRALTNLSTLPENHTPYTQLIQRLYDLLDSGGSSALRTQALRVLVNLSSNRTMVPHLLAAKAPSCLIHALNPNTETEDLLRWITLLGNVMTSVREQAITAETLPPEYKAPSPETMHTALYGHDNIAKLKSKVFVLSGHSHDDVRFQASKVYACLT